MYSIVYLACVVDIGGNICNELYLFFSDNNITLHIPVSTQTGDLDKQSILNEINMCMEQNLNGHMSVNSFNTNMLMGLQQEVMNAETEKTLEQIRTTLYQITDCKQDNSYYLP